jgi:serine/threonine-protein kinase
LPPSLPPDVARLLRRCLEKDSRGGCGTSATLALTSTSPWLRRAISISVSRDRRGRKIAWMVWLPTAAAAILAALLIAQRFGGSDGAAPSTQPAALSRFVETVTGGLQLAPAPSLALTQDGRRLAYVAVQDGVRTMYVRDLGDAAARPLAGTEDADQPFFSPDGRWLAFFADSKLKKVAVAGGTPITIAPVANPRGGTWLPDNTIIFAPSAASVLMRVSAEGGKASRRPRSIDS